MIGIVSISKQGNALAKKLSGLLDNTTCYTLQKWNLPDTKPINGRLKEFCGKLNKKHDSLVFIMASGIVVRSIAPWLKDKTTDPAVVIIDDKGNNVISLLSGHLGGANTLTIKIASLLNSHPVITTASDVNKLPSVDMLVKSKGLVIDSLEDAKKITAMIVNREKVELVDDQGFFDGILMPFPGIESHGKIIISNKNDLIEQLPFSKLVPRNIVLGIGCKKDTDKQKLINFIEESLDRYNLDRRSVKTIASVSVKKNEQAIVAAGNMLGCQLKFFSCISLSMLMN